MKKIIKLVFLCLFFIATSSMCVFLHSMEDQLDMIEALKTPTPHHVDDEDAEEASFWCTHCPEPIVFLASFFSDFSKVGAIGPSSKELAKAMTEHIQKRDIESGFPGRNLLEVGPGTGVFTEKIIAQMGPYDHLDLVEYKEKFCRILQQKFGAHPQVHIHNMSITEFHPNTQYHFIVSGLPFNNFSAEFVQQTLRLYKTWLVPGGSLSYFEYLILPTIKLYGLQVASCFFSSALRKKEDYCRTLMQIQAFKRHFEAATEKKVLMNLPSARAITCHHLRLTE